MTSIQSGNLAREWDEEQRGPELWDALQTLRANSTAGLDALSTLAEAGSSLSMMYLGDAYLRGRHKVRLDHDLGEYWLRRSADNGSVEGSFLLAHHLLHSGQINSAVGLYDHLADLDYSPAQFVLGWYYLKGEFVEKDLDKSISYLRRADENGHLHAGRWISHILMSEGGNSLSWLRGLIKKVRLTIPFVRTKVTNPNSDTLRT